MDSVERREFLWTLLAAGVAGEALSAEARAGQTPSLPPETLKALATLTDQAPTAEEMEAIRTALERQLENIRKVRAFQIPQAVEPSLKFRVRT
jgi:hypothetical protein